MSSAIKMDLYKMFRMKSFYVIYIIMIACILLTTSLDDQILEEYYGQNQEALEELANKTAEEEEIENTNLGMTIQIPKNAEQKITLMDFLYANVQGKFLALFLVIFVVLFTMADINTGYMKHIGGQVNHRSILILSKAVVLFIYTLLTFGVFMFAQLLANGMVFDTYDLGNVSLLLKYVGVEIVLNYAFAMICMTLAIFLKSNVFSMLIVVCMCMNVMQIFYSLIDKILEKAGINGVHVIKYTITGKISMLPYKSSGKEILVALGIGATYAIAMIFASCTIFKKRDIA